MFSIVEKERVRRVKSFFSLVGLCNNDPNQCLLPFFFRGLVLSVITRKSGWCRVGTEKIILDFYCLLFVRIHWKGWERCGDIVRNLLDSHDQSYLSL